jgi:sugar/nucleoside kinase (ribokinase family)
VTAYDIIVLGDYFYDLIYTGLTEFPELGREVMSTDVTTTGGAMYITAVSLSRLGARVGWPAYFGDDFYSRSVYDFAVAEGVDLSLARHVSRPYRRVTTALPLEGERAFATYVDPEADDLYDHWRQALESCDFRHLHVGGLDCVDKMRPLVEIARQRGATVSFDCQDGPHLDNPGECMERISSADIFMPNAREAKIVAQMPTVDEALSKLAEQVGLVVVKDGPNGSWAARGGERYHADSIYAGPVVDTTGAGDCFNAGFLYGYVVEHQPIERCLRYGNICGGLSVTGVGGATAAPRREALYAWLSRTEQPKDGSAE